MAYTATITKQSITKVKDGFMVSINVVVNDGVEDVFTQTVSKRHVTGDPINEIKAILQNKIKVEWDKYIGEKTIYDHAGYATLCSDLTTSLNAYTNQ